MNDHELTALMYAETENAPPARIDLAKTMREGRRQRQPRTFGPAVAAVAVLAVTAGTVAVVTTSGSADRHPQVASSPTATTTYGTAPAAPASFDPLRLRLSVGWLPAGLERHDPVIATGNQQILWSEPVAATENPRRWVEVTIYAAGIMPWQLASGHWIMEATEPVNDARAAWLVIARTTADPRLADACKQDDVLNEPRCASVKGKTEHQPEALAWRWAPNAWAVARILETDESTQRTIARRVAESVRTDGDDPARSPFTVKRPPAPLQLTMIEPYTLPPLYSVALRFGLGGEPVTSIGSDDSKLVTLTVTWVPPGHQNKDKPNRTLDGTNAAVHFESRDWGSITLYRDGYEVSLWIPTHEARRVVDEKTAIAIVTSVTPVAAPTDRTHWTSNPLQ